MLAAFLLYCHGLGKQAPWALQDIYSFQLRLIEGGKVVTITQFNAVVAALAPLGLLQANALFQTIKNDLGRQVKLAAQRGDVKKCAPWHGNTDLGARANEPAKKLMLAIWLLTGARFSTICQLEQQDLSFTTVKGQRVLAVTLWYDKIFERQGRTVILTCNCVPGMHQDMQLCPLCPEVNDFDISTALTREGWFQLQKELGCPFHSMRRRLALEIARINLHRPTNRKIKLEAINIFMGWVRRSLMHGDYTFDLHLHPAEAFPISLPSLVRNIELTAYVESAEALKDHKITEFRALILMTSKDYADKLKEAEQIWADLDIKI
jgi:hypothetical protein